MLRRIDAPRVGTVPEEVDDLVVERDLPVDREVPVRNESSTSRSRSSAISGTSSSRIWAKMRVTSADFISGSKSSSRMSYGSSRGSKHAMYRLRSSTLRSSTGRNNSKLDVAFASSQVGTDSAEARAISSRNSAGTRTAFS